MPRPQFSLKTIFVAMTLVAVACPVAPPVIAAILAWASPPPRSQCPGGLKPIRIKLPFAPLCNTMLHDGLPDGTSFDDVKLNLKTGTWERLSQSPAPTGDG